MIFIFSYNRPNLLLRLLKELDYQRVVVIDDGSDYDPKKHLNYCQYHRLIHGGKPYFWNTWQYALDMCKESDHDFFLFLQDDLSNVNISAIHHIHNSIDKPYTYSTLNVGANRGWTPIKEHTETVAGIYSIFGSYVDCNYFCNRKALEAIDFKQAYIHPDRFRQRFISSGVGQWQSRQYWMKGIPMYRPVKSLASHGDHESQMHPIERKRNPLVTCK